MNGDAIILTPRAQQQLIVLTALDRGELLTAEAADLLVHGNRGRRSPRRVADAIRVRIVRLAQTTYAGLNHKHLSELLAERHGLALSHPTIHPILREAGMLVRADPGYSEHHGGMGSSVACAPKTANCSTILLKRHTNRLR